MRARTDELVAAVVGLYGEGLERIFATLAEAGQAGAELAARLADDGVVASLMLIHGLYPVALEQRVAEALASVRPYMESHGGDVELLGLEDGIARVRLVGSCDGCPASASTLELAIKQALDEAAPDLEGLVVEGVAGGAPAAGGRRRRARAADRLGRSRSRRREAGLVRPRRRSVGRRRRARASHACQRDRAAPGAR